MNRLLVSAAVLGLVSSAPAFAQTGDPASATATADATIVSTITISKTQDMSFGSLASPSVSTVVTVDAAGNLTGGLEVPGSNTGSAATFDVAGDPTFAYSVDITDPSDTISLVDTGSAGGAAMPLVLSIDGGVATGRTISAATNDVIVVGSLTVGADQAPSTYQGTMTVQVQYD